MPTLIIGAFIKDFRTTLPQLPEHDLARWDRDKIAAFSQTTFWNAFSWMKRFEFRVRFHLSLFPRDKWSNTKQNTKAPDYWPFVRGIHPHTVFSSCPLWQKGHDAWAILSGVHWMRRCHDAEVGLFKNAFLNDSIGYDFSADFSLFAGSTLIKNGVIEHISIQWRALPFKTLNYLKEKLLGIQIRFVLRQHHANL